MPQTPVHHARTDSRETAGVLLRFTGKGRAFADLILAEIHAAEEKAMQETVARFSSEFVEALEFYAKTFHDTLHLRKDDDEA